MGRLFGGSPALPPLPPPPPPPPPPAPLPDPEDVLLKEGKRRKAAEQQTRSGRTSTILSQGSETLG